jgi:hypothetical protein
VPTEKTTTCKYEYECGWKAVKSAPEKETIVPYKICSFDIEASSSHGDFPVPIKSYKKLAANIMDILLKQATVDTLTKERVEKMIQKIIMTSFGYDTMDDVDTVYPISKPSKSVLTNMIDHFIKKTVTMSELEHAKEATIESAFEKMKTTFTKADDFPEELEDEEEEIYDAEDAAKTRSLDIELLTAEGKSYKALQKTRQDELKTLSDSDQLIKQKIYDEQDAQKTEALNIQLLNLQGKATEALKLTRDREKAAVSATDKAILQQIYDLQDEAAALQKLNAVRSLEVDIYQLLGKSSEALKLQRESELSTTDESLKTLKKYKFALQDEAALKDKITAAYNKQKEALKSTVSSLEGSIATLKDLKSSALSSSLTPQQLYQNRKNEFLTLSAAASAKITDTSTEAEKTARDTALNKLPQAATDFLDSSRTIFASSAQFTTDQGLVSSYIDSATTALESQKSTAEQQLAKLDDSVSALNIIETNTETTASLLAQLVTLQTATAAAKTAVISDTSLVGSTITAHAAGGIASGISLVGELGPEIVDFKTPGRVYSNSASNDLFNTKELVQEIRSLRQEVKQLRDDQQQQTGHLITATYDASAQNAEEVTAGAETALNTQSWKTRSQIKLA